MYQFRWLAQPRLCLRIVSSRWFDYAIGCVILFNSLLVGIEVQLSLVGQDVDWMQPLDTGFIALYFIELCMRLIGMGWRQCFCDGWFLLDFTLVVLGIVTVFVLMFGSGGDLGLLESVLVVRAMRLLRLIRALRMLKYFRTVWRLVYGLLTSHNAMFSTLALILLTLYVFACLGVELITKDENLLEIAEIKLIVDTHFISVFVSMLTLVQFVTVDSVAYIYAPLIKEKPILALYFFAIILIVSIALMNLVTAVLVEGALENAAHDREADKLNLQEKLKEAVPRLREVFAAMDANGDGNVTLEEIEAVPMDVIPKEFFEKNSVGSMQAQHARWCE
ncbi:Scn1a [Symbiodinium pilosum]|uniref:Scn1a protein n=1 Tax=Symbiodinium pilosum TaxID=2952 RepID=A0A812IRF5_SYMPI|nr:Scn1a [Symbiodinium pilosum]